MKTFEFTGEQKDQIEWLLKAFKADNLRYDQAFNQLKSIVSERITPEPKAMTEQEITNKEIYELECILEKVRKGGFMYTFAEAINDIENIFKPFMVQSAQITPEPGESGQKRESPFIGEITISDLRKLFAHRASRISEDINQGANQLMTLTDFRLALADMRWRIYNDGLSEPCESGQSAEEKVQWNEYEYAKQLAMLIHARCYPELPQWEPIPDLMGLLTQIDNMVCGLERKVDTLHSAEEWDKAEGILGRCTCAEIYTSRRMTDPNCAWCEYHVDLIKAMRLHASQVCADKEREISLLKKELDRAKEEIEKSHMDKIYSIHDLKSELSAANESLTVLLRKNAELLKSVRPEVVVPSEEWINGFKEEGRVASNWTIDKIKSLNPTLTFTELNHEK